jgi:hypothetical protein
MVISAPIFVGFWPKNTMLRPAWLNVLVVREICSVSNCISAGPDHWIEQWQHNAFGFYDSESIALALVADDIDRQYDMYAYEMFPFCVLASVVETFETDVVRGQVPADYEFLGYDVVTKSISDFFECSPLSCNSAAADFVINSYCLLDDEIAAYAALLAMSSVERGFEPGPYYLFKVYRQKISDNL